jgi:hypothetical protein
MRVLFLDRAEWVLSGSLDGWGDPLIPLFDLMVFVVVPTEVRLQRLRERETRRFGAAAVATGGWRHQDLVSSSSGPRATTTIRAWGAT